MNDITAGTCESQPGKRPNSGWISLASRLGTGKGWNFIPLAPGAFGVFIAYNLYPLLDGRFALMGIVFLFFLLTGLVQRATVLSGLALVLLAATLFLNGGLDRAPLTVVKTTVIDKATVTGSQRTGTHYHVIVSSWRPGRRQEEFDVDSGIYHRMVVGRAAAVELHKGYFSLPWLGTITPE